MQGCTSYLNILHGTARDDSSLLRPDHHTRNCVLDDFASRGLAGESKVKISPSTQESNMMYSSLERLAQSSVCFYIHIKKYLSHQKVSLPYLEYRLDKHKCFRKGK